MQTGSLKQLLALTMAVLLTFSTTVWAAGPEFSGHIRATGVVLANAVPLPDGGTVRAGDRIATRPASLAVISSKTHGRLEVRSDSQARLGAHRIELDRGAVAATSLPIAVDGFTIQPQNPARAWYAVAKRDGRLLVAAHRGSLIISAAGAPAVTVAEGAFAERTEPPADEKDKKDKKKGAAGAATTGGWTIGGLSHAASVALVIGIGAGVAAAAAGAAITLSGDKPSPE